MQVDGSVPSRLTDLGLLVATSLLFIATMWYTWVTSRMARIMSAELSLKVRPSMGWGEPQPQLEGGRIVVQQLVTNTGVGYVTIEGVSATLWKVASPNQSRLGIASQSLPVHLAPGQSSQFTVVLAPDASVYLLGVAGTLLDHAVGGTVKCSYMGVEGKLLVRELALPQARH